MQRPDAPAALTELRRVLRPGGRYHFLEHGRAPDVRVRKVQRRMRPVRARLFGGCDFTKPVLELIVEAGFKVDHVESFYQRAAPRYVGADSRGAAVNPFPVPYQWLWELAADPCGRESEVFVIS